MILMKVAHDHPARFSALGFPDMCEGPISILVANDVGTVKESFKIKLTGPSIHSAILEAIGHVAKPKSIPLLQNKIPPSSCHSSTNRLPDSVNMTVSSVILCTAFPELVKSFYESRSESAEGNVMSTTSSPLPSHDGLRLNLTHSGAMPSVAGPSTQDIVDLTQDSSDTNSDVIDLTQDLSDADSDVIDLTQDSSDVEMDVIDLTQDGLCSEGPSSRGATVDI